MPPKRKAAAKKVIRNKEEPVENIDPNEKMVDNDDDIDEEMSEPRFTSRRRPFEKAAESLVDDKLRMLEDRMSNTDNTQLEEKKMPEASKVKSKTKSKKDKTDNDNKEKKTRKRAISEDRTTKTGENLGVKNNRKKKEKVESEILSLIEPIKRTRRANSVDPLAAEVPSVVTNIQKKNQKSTKSKSEDDDKQKKSKRVIKKTESMPEPIIKEKKTKPKKTAKKVLDSEEDIIPNTEKPTIKQKGLKKEQVFKKYTEDTLEIQTGTEALKISKLKKDKPAKRGVKKEIIKYTNNNTDSDNNVVTSDDCSDYNSDSDVAVKPLKSIFKKQPDNEKDVAEEEFDENSDAELHVDNNEEGGTNDEDQTEDVEDQAKDVEDQAIDIEDQAKDVEDQAKNVEDQGRDVEDEDDATFFVESDEVRVPAELTDSDFNEDEEPIFVEKKPTKKGRKLKQPLEDEKVVKLPRGRKIKVSSFEHDVVPDISSPEGTAIETEDNPKKRKTKAKAKK